MAEENHISEQNIEYHLVNLFEKLENLKNGEIIGGLKSVKRTLRVEIRTLEFWRSVTCECLASFVYIFIVCGAAASAGVGASISSMILATALAAGFTMASLTQCFAHISGAHINPAVTVAMGVTRNISLIRTAMYIIAQCGGGIAGAAFLYGVTVPGYQSNLSATIGHSSSVPPWERFAVELILTFIIVFSYFVSMDPQRKWMNSPALTIGATYSACSFVSMPYLNPARSLGPSFVLSKWENHWVVWLGPVIGGLASGLTYQYILHPKRNKLLKDQSEGDSSSIHSDEDTYDDVDKPVPPKFHGSSYNTYRATGNSNATSGYCPSLTSASLYSAPASKLERVESLYGGTKSLYCKSPPLTRANLNRSQSVYTKSSTTVNRDALLKSGPLVPAQSLYPMRITPQSHVQNQNVQNQMQQRSDNIYGARGVTPGTARTEQFSSERPAVYGNRCNAALASENTKFDENPKITRSNRPESMYGLMNSNQVRPRQTAPSDDSSYSSYQSSAAPPPHRNNSNTNTTYNNSNPSASASYNSSTQSGNTGYNTSNMAGPYNNTTSNTGFPTKPCTTSSFGQRTEVRQSPPQLMQSTTSNPSSYHHSIPQHSPNTQY